MRNQMTEQERVELERLERWTARGQIVGPIAAGRLERLRLRARLERAVNANQG